MPKYVLFKEFNYGEVSPEEFITKPRYVCDDNSLTANLAEAMFFENEKKAKKYCEKFDNFYEFSIHEITANIKPIKKRSIA